MKPALFIDRDGTLIADKHYLHTPEEVVVFEGAAEALAGARRAGFALVMITNQSGVGRGYFTMADVERVHAHLQEVLGAAGGAFDRIYTAPEAPEQPSRGRKPSPAFVFDAREELGLDLANSFVIGDKLIDLQCGWNAGTRRSILVRTGYGAELERTHPEALGDAWVVDTLAQAVDRILKA